MGRTLSLPQEMLRVVVISALIAVAIAAPTWTSQLAQATEEKAELTSLAERSSYGVECHKGEMPISFTAHSMPQGTDLTSMNYTWDSFNYTNHSTLMSVEDCKRECLKHENEESSCKAYWWQQRLVQMPTISPIFIGTRASATRRQTSKSPTKIQRSTIMYTSPLIRKITLSTTLRRLTTI